MDETAGIVSMFNFRVKNKSLSKSSENISKMNSFVRIIKHFKKNCTFLVSEWKNYQN